VSWNRGESDRRREEVDDDSICKMEGRTYIARQLPRPSSRSGVCGWLF
jgi:hypothetical protein